MNPLQEIGLIVTIILFLAGGGFMGYALGEKEGLKTACNTAGGILVAEEYCLPKTQVLKLTSP